MENTVEFSQLRDSTFWNDDESCVLLNPRLSEVERQHLQALVDGVPVRAAHVWVATSGSTGARKMVALSKQALKVSAQAVNQHLQVEARDRWALVLPIFHVGGLAILARAHVSQTPVMWQDLWNPEAFCQLCERETVTLSSLVSAQVDDLVREGRKAPRSLRAVMVGGGGLPKALHEQAKLLGWPLLPTYGLTEAASSVAVAPLEALAFSDVNPSRRLRVLSHWKVREEDELLHLKGDALLSGYALRNTESGEVEFLDPRQEGWLRTEDRVRLTEEAQVKFLEPLGRRGDFLKIGGESVSLSHLEEILQAQIRKFCTEANSVDATLVAFPDERLGNVIGLAQAGLNPEQENAVLEAFHQQVAPYERVRRVYRLSEIPRSGLKKVLRARLLADLLTLSPHRLF